MMELWRWVVSKFRTFPLKKCGKGRWNFCWFLRSTSRVPSNGIKTTGIPPAILLCKCGWQKIKKAHVQNIRPCIAWHNKWLLFASANVECTTTGCFECTEVSHFVLYEVHCITSTVVSIKQLLAWYLLLTVKQLISTPSQQCSKCVSAGIQDCSVLLTMYWDTHSWPSLLPAYVIYYCCISSTPCLNWLLAIYSVLASVVSHFISTIDSGLVLSTGPGHSRLNISWNMKALHVLENVMPVAGLYLGGIVIVICRCPVIKTSFALFLRPGRPTVTNHL